jgi:hypothetical protein
LAEQIGRSPEKFKQRFRENENKSQTRPPQARFVSTTNKFYRTISRVRAHGMWTYEPRQGRKAATVVCSVSAVVTLTLFQMTKAE